MLTERCNATPHHSFFFSFFHHAYSSYFAFSYEDKFCFYFFPFALYFVVVLFTCSLFLLPYYCKLYRFCLVLAKMAVPFDLFPLSARNITNWMVVCKAKLKLYDFNVDIKAFLLHLLGNNCNEMQFLNGIGNL